MPYKGKYVLCFILFFSFTTQPLILGLTLKMGPFWDFKGTFPYEVQTDFATQTAPELSAQLFGLLATSFLWIIDIYKNKYIFGLHPLS